MVTRKDVEVFYASLGGNCELFLPRDAESVLSTTPSDENGFYKPIDPMTLISPKLGKVHYYTLDEILDMICKSAECDIKAITARNEYLKLGTNQQAIEDKYWALEEQYAITGDISPENRNLGIGVHIKHMATMKTIQIKLSTSANSKIRNRI